MIMSDSSWLKKIEYKVNRSSYRERVLIAISGVLIIVVFWNHFFYSKLAVSRKKVNVQLESVQVQVKTLSQALQALSQDIQSSPTRDLRARKIELQNNIEAMDKEIQKFMDELISPEEMVVFLKSVLESSPGLQITRIKNRPAKPFLSEQDSISQKNVKIKEKKTVNQKEAKTSDSTKNTNDLSASEPENVEPKESVEVETLKKQNDALQLYMHGLEITFSGNFFDVVDYLKQIEKVKKRIIWDSLEYKVLKYPVAEVTLSVITLSDKPEWVEI